MVADATYAQRHMAQVDRNDEDKQGEFLPEISEISLQFIKLPRKKNVKIFRNKFKPINLYLLQQMQNLTLKTY